MTKKRQMKYSEIMAYVSHERRTPVSIAKSAISLVLDDMVQGKKAKYVLARANKSFDRIISIISENLDITRLERGKKKYNFSSINVNKKIKNIINDFKPRTNKNKIRLTYKASKFTPVVWADKSSFEQILINRIDNSLNLLLPMAT